ncbi:MAG TPA: alpha-N-arabinofuranosidase, partial [Candidatus Dormibacteraeota bacterium]|nr:alpha-N-arabinofuranosidase [Candidatus Dormibacteraeota bacterium]
MSSVARIKVDPGRRLGEVDPRIYGGFIEHLGRCIYGGIFDEGSPLSDERGFRRDVLGALDQLSLTSL